jgi:chromosome segregation ATPase
MADTVVDMVSKQDFASAQKEIADLRLRLEAAKEDKVKEQVTALEKTIAARDEEIKSVKTELENAKAAKSDAQKALETAKTEAESLKTKLTEAETKIEENTKSVVKANRVSALVDKGVEKVEAERIVEAAASATDELFAVILDTHAKLVEAKKAATAAFPPADEKKDEKKDKKKKENDSAKADEQKLDGAQAEEEEVPLSTDASAAEEVDAVVAGLADFLTQKLESEKKNK